jgi:hypothetical protein
MEVISVQFASYIISVYAATAIFIRNDMKMGKAYAKPVIASYYIP